MKKDGGYYWGYLICLGLLAGLIFLLQGVDPSLAEELTRENGPVENLTVVGYGIALVLMAVLLRGLKHYFWFLLLVLAMALRELDFHARFTSITTTSTRFYVSPEVPVVAKIIALAVFFLLLYGLIRLAVSYLPALVAGLKSGRPEAVGVFLGIFLAVIAKLLDGLSRKLADFGVDLSAGASLTAECVEEVLELGIPVMFILAVLAGARSLTSFKNAAPEEQGRSGSAPSCDGRRD
ncbi:MAG: hypothetical protein ACLFS7_00560 [Desulfosudaceae bacterium]